MSTTRKKDREIDAFCEEISRELTNLLFPPVRRKPKKAKAEKPAVTETQTDLFGKGDAK